MKKFKKIITVVLVTTMLFSLAISVSAAPASVGKCQTMGCYNTLAKTSQRIGMCSRYCGAYAYIYRCPSYANTLYHQYAEAWCDNGHQN